MKLASAEKSEGPFKNDTAVSALFIDENWIVAPDSTLDNILGCRKWGSVLYQAKSSLILKLGPLAVWSLVNNPTIEIYSKKENQACKIKLLAIIKSENQAFKAITILIYLNDFDKEVSISSVVKDTQNFSVKPLLPKVSDLTFAPTRRIRTRSLTKTSKVNNEDQNVYEVPSSPVTIWPDRQPDEISQEKESKNTTAFDAIFDRDDALYRTVQANIQKKLDEIIASRISFKNQIEKPRQSDITKRRTSHQPQSPIKKKPKSLPVSPAFISPIKKSLSRDLEPPESSEEECEEVDSEEIKDEEEFLLFNQSQASKSINTTLDTSTQRFQNAWEAIISKYSDAKYAESGDVVDLLTGNVVEDNGHLRSLPVDQKSVWKYYEEQEEEYDPKDEIDEVDLFTITRGGLFGNNTASESIFKNKLNETARNKVGSSNNGIPPATTKEKINNDSELEEITFSQFKSTQESHTLATKRPDHVAGLIADSAFVHSLKTRQALRRETRDPKYNLQTLDELQSLPRGPFENFVDTDQLEQELNDLTLGGRNEKFLKTCNEYLKADFARADEIESELKVLDAGPLDDNQWLPEILETAVTSATITAPVSIS